MINLSYMNNENHLKNCSFFQVSIRKWCSNTSEQRIPYQTENLSQINRQKARQTITYLTGQYLIILKYI